MSYYLVVLYMFAGQPTTSDSMLYRDQASCSAAALRIGLALPAAEVLDHSIRFMCVPQAAALPRLPAADRLPKRVGV